MTIHELEVFLIAHRFADVLRHWLSEEEFAEMKRRNEQDPDYADKCCASHDYCDANMAMMEAFESVIGTNIIPDDGSEISEELCELWGKSWELARRLYIGEQS